MIIRLGFVNAVRKGLAEEMTTELEAWNRWLPQDGLDQSHFEHSDGGLKLGHIGPACREFQQWLLGDGFDWLETQTSQKLRWAHGPSATRWKPGDFLRRHSDSGPAKTWTFTIFLGRDWVHDWGGHTYVLNPETEEWEYIPTAFDRMVIFHDREHYVSQVATYAERNRYAITAWLQNEDDFNLLPVPSQKVRRPLEST